MPDNRPAVYLEGNNVIYRASALGHCLRMLWAARSGLDPKPFPEKIQAAMDEGTRLEPIILDLLRTEYHWEFSGQSQQQIELNVGTWNGNTIIVRGKVDEVYASLPVDVKACNQSLCDEMRLFGLERYYWQQSAYAHGFGSNLYYMPVYNKETHKIESWSLTPKVALYSREDIRDRVMQVEEAYESGTMPEQCSNEYGCPYFYLHDTKQKTTDTLPETAINLVRARIKITEKINAFAKARGVLNEALTKQLTVDTSYHLDDYVIVIQRNGHRLNVPAVKHLLTELEVDWQNDDELWTPGKGTKVVMTPKGKS